MGAIICELCGSNDITKQDGLFVCQHCGTKYAPEDAKKLFVEGTVKVDNSERLSNLYKIARRAKDDNNSESAEKYYDLILMEDPMSWEATLQWFFDRLRRRGHLLAASELLPAGSGQFAQRRGS